MFPDAGTCCGAPDAICCYEFTTEHCNLRLAILDGHVSGWADDLCGSSLRTLRRHLEVLLNEDLQMPSKGRRLRVLS